MMKVLYGFYGMGNFGDDMFLYVLNQNIQKKEGFVSLSPEIIGIDNIKFLISPIFTNLYKKNNILGKLTRILFVTINYLKCKEFIYFGGSTLSSDTSISMLKYLDFLSNFIKRDFKAIGVSIGPFYNEEDEKLVMNFLKKFKIVEVRDKNSLNYSKKYKLNNVKLTHDIVLDLEKKVDKKENNNLIVTLVSYESLNQLNPNDEINRNDAILNSLVDICKSNKDLNIDFVVLNKNKIKGDLEITENMYNKLKTKVHNNIELHIYQDNLDEIIDLIERSRGVFTCRLHGGIVSYALDKPFILLEYHKKCSDFLDDINKNEILRVPRNINDKGVLANKLNILLKDDCY